MMKVSPKTGQLDRLSHFWSAQCVQDGLSPIKVELENLILLLSWTCGSVESRVDILVFVLQDHFHC